MKVDYCPNKDCKYCEIDYKAVRESQLFDVPDLQTIDCIRTEKDCIFYKENPNPYDQLVSKLFGDVKNAPPWALDYVNKKCILIKHGEEVIFCANEGTEDYNKIINMRDKSLLRIMYVPKNTSFMLYRDGDTLNAYVTNGYEPNVRYSYTNYCRVYTTPFPKEK